MIDPKRVESTFLDLVQLDSPSKFEAPVAQYCLHALQAIPGCTAWIDDTAVLSGSNTGNVRAFLPGSKPVTLYLTAHMDNVEPCRGVKPVIRDGVVYSDGTTVLGGDDKGGIAAVIEAVRGLSQSAEPRASVGVLLTVQEEVGLFGSKSLPDDYFHGETALVCDGDSKPGIVDVGAPYHYTFKAEFRGVASHAGVAPEAGRSAIQMAAWAISQMELGRLENGASANVGKVSGGSANNVIPANCIVTGECRSLDGVIARETMESMEAILQEAAARFGGTVDSQWTLEYEGFRYADDDPAVLRILDAARSLGLTAGTEVSGGGTDANILSAKGARPLVLGAGMTDIHSTKESIALADIVDLARLLEACALSW